MARRNRLRARLARANWFGVFRASFMLLFLAYPGVSLKILRMFNCTHIEDGWYLAADMRLRCYDGRWAGYAIYALTMFGLYVIGFPLLVFTILWRRRTRLFGSQYDAVVEANQKSYGFLYVTYGPTAWWWEVEELARKLLLSAVVVLIEQGSPLQVTLAVLVSGWAHVLHAVYKPWGVGSVLYNLQHGSLFVTSYVFLMGLLFKVQGVNSASRSYALMAATMLVLCIGFMVAWFAVVLVRITRAVRAHQQAQAEKEAGVAAVAAGGTPAKAASPRSRAVSEWGPPVADVTAASPVMSTPIPMRGRSVSTLGVVSGNSSPVPSPRVRRNWERGSTYRSFGEDYEPSAESLARRAAEAAVAGAAGGSSTPRERKMTPESPSPVVATRASPGSVADGTASTTPSAAAPVASASASASASTSAAGGGSGAGAGAAAGDGAVAGGAGASGVQAASVVSVAADSSSSSDDDGRGPAASPHVRIQQLSSKRRRGGAASARQRVRSPGHSGGEDFFPTVPDAVITVKNPLFTKG
jgi:hypothetical protein